MPSYVRTKRKGGRYYPFTIGTSTPLLFVTKNYSIELLVLRRAFRSTPFCFAFFFRNFPIKNFLFYKFFVSIQSFLLLNLTISERSSHLCMSSFATQLSAVGVAVLLVFFGLTAYLQNTERSLRAAAFRGNTELIEELLNDGHEILKPDDLGNAPIFYAIKGGHREAIELLLANGASLLGTSNSGGSTVFHWATASGPRILSAVLSIASSRYAKEAIGKELNRLNVEGDGPIHLAIVFGDPEVVSSLFPLVVSVILVFTCFLKVPLIAEASGDLGLKNKEGKTALHLASYRGDVQCARALLSSGAPPLIQDDQGRTAYAIASNST